MDFCTYADIASFPRPMLNYSKCFVPQTHLFSVKEECNRKILSMRDSEKAGVDYLAM